MGPARAGDIVPGCEVLNLGEAYFIGGVDGAAGVITYLKFGVSLNRNRNAIGVPTFLRVGSRQIRVKDATPETLSAAGWPELASGVAPRRIFGVRVRPGTDAGVDLAFWEGRAEYLSIRCYLGETCDFAIGWEGYPMVTLPAREHALKAALPSSGTVGPCRSSF
jgi:hypothetical protein